MKEKTFEELIEEKLALPPKEYILYSYDIKELLQQVREATIKECLDFILSNENCGKMSWDVGYELMQGKIKIDRIKTEK